MSTKPAPRSARPTRRPRPAKASRASAAKSAPSVRPFSDAFGYLDSWYFALGPARIADESPAGLLQIPSAEDRLGMFGFLSACADVTLEAGTPLPFEEFARAHDLDLLDRLLLLSLLRDAHDPLSQHGLRLIRLFRSVYADRLSVQHEVSARLEEGGKLRDLAAVESIPDSFPGRRLYRLPRRLAEPLTTGSGDPEGLPRIPADSLESLDLFVFDVTQLVLAVEMTYPETEKIWNGPRKGSPGWDHTALRRRRLAARLQACSRAEGDRVGGEIRRLGLEGDERLAWALLLRDTEADKVGLAVPLVLRFLGPLEDPESAAERILGPGSRLARADAIRFNRPDGPLLSRVVWLSREARSRVVPWPRNAFVARATTDLERAADLPRVGFDPTGPAVQDRTRGTGRTP